MKKLLVVFGLVLAFSVLLVCSLCACDGATMDGNSNIIASAEYAFTPSVGIVRPNLLDEYTFTSLVSVNSAPTDISKLLTTTASYTVDSNGLVHFTSTGNLYFAFHTYSGSFQSALYLFCRYVAPSGNSISVSFTEHDLSGTYSDRSSNFYLQRSSNTSFSSVQSPVSLGITSSTSGFYDTDVVVTIPVASDYYFWLFKYESFNTNGTVVSGFTGIPVEGFTYLSDTSFGGYVYPNLLNGSDFFQTPYYTTDSLSLIPSNIWTTDLPSSSFVYEEDSFDYLYTIGNTTITLPGDEVSHSLRYKYVTEGDGSYSFYYTFAFDLYSPDVGGTVTISLGNSSLSPVSSSFTSSSSEQLITLSTGAIQTGVQLNIIVEFDSVSSDTDLIFCFSKFEVGESFTGYVYPQHDISFFVRDNLVTNYSFSTVPTVMAYPRKDNGVLDTWFSSYDFNFSYSSGGLVIDNSSNVAPQWLYYHLTPLFSFVGSSMTLSLDLECDTPLNITVSNYFTHSSTQVDYTPVDLASGYFLVSQSSYTVSMHFDATSDLFICIEIPANSRLVLYACKLEVGDNFTGYCPNFSVPYQQGYTDGYDAGYTQGVDDFGTQTIQLAFNNVEAPYRIEQGWRDFGFSSAEELLKCSISLYSYFYEVYSFNVLSYGTFGLVDGYGNYVGAGVYVSRDADLEGIHVENANYVAVAIYEHSCTLTIADPEYPQNWNPVQYPLVRVVSLTITRGIENVLAQYKESSYNAGKNIGISIGYDRGYVQGKADGYTLAESVLDTGGWIGFFSAFVDTPVKVITSLLDFDFFGFNLLSVVKILLLFSLVFMVIRLFTKGKVQQ